VTGLKIYPNPDSVTRGLNTMFSNFDRARWMGQNGRQAVEAGFTWDRVADQVLTVYDPECAVRYGDEGIAD
jgi:glycosyltransferase involved in cell wall biosynthesis